MGHKKPVVGDADVPHHPLALHLHQVLVGGVLLGGAEGRVVELENVNVIGLHPPQAQLQVALHHVRVAGGGVGAFGGDDNLFPHIGEGIANLLLAVGVGIGGIKKVHPRLVGGAQQPSRLVKGNPLDGQRPKGGLRHHQPGAPQAHLFHFSHAVISPFLLRFFQPPDGLFLGIHKEEILPLVEFINAFPF